MPEENYHCHSGEELMSPNEILKLTEQFVKMGVNKVRLTGGEPLMRKDFSEILSLISTLPIKITLTNGVKPMRNSRMRFKWRSVVIGIECASSIRMQLL
jgi:cyclic pyranopterin phosphate synthase